MGFVNLLLCVFLCYGGVGVDVSWGGFQREVVGYSFNPVEYEGDAQCFAAYGAWSYPEPFGVEERAVDPPLDHNDVDRLMILYADVG